ncbi:MAG: di-trans,poly-cis-decaprenylcistransferase [Actinobacteria bacterium HGW-Actinobacteria-7]|jgi:undecaprenyl diphosphate synthase|nr:MAG: di-trans,poly-cis-decaprenylcistransferase [Actinobacteria bacterium HGW-Actinobacteria-7]
MDGNGRWAEQRGLPRLAGHKAGAQAVREVIAASIELGIEYLTIYSFSSENWSRPRDEVTGLMSLFVEVLERELVNLEKMRVRVKVIGSIDRVPQATARAFERCVERTKLNDGLTLVVALSYGGRVDIVEAVRDIAQAAVSGAIQPAQIDEALVASRLSTAGIPDPDLLVRTSGEMRVSNFLLWEIAYSEFWVTETLWPDFDRSDLLAAAVDYQGRTRRFGGS